MHLARQASLVGTSYLDMIVDDPNDPDDPFLDNNDALLIVESNDYNNPGESWVLKGLQILSNDSWTINNITQNLDGSAIDLSKAVGDTGGSSTGDTIGEDSSTNPLKILDAGFTVATPEAATLDLDLTFNVVDADGVQTAQQTVDLFL